MQVRTLQITFLVQVIQLSNRSNNVGHLLSELIDAEATQPSDQEREVRLRVGAGSDLLHTRCSSTHMYLKISYQTCYMCCTYIVYIHMYTCM